MQSVGVRLWTTDYQLSIMIAMRREQTPYPNNHPRRVKRNDMFRVQLGKLSCNLLRKRRQSSRRDNRTAKQRCLGGRPSEEKLSSGTVSSLRTDEQSASFRFPIFKGYRHTDIRDRHAGKPFAIAHINSSLEKLQPRPAPDPHAVWCGEAVHHLASVAVEDVELLIHRGLIVRVCLC